jgi:hypothetical protein
MLHYRSLGSGLLQIEMDCGRNAQYKELYIPPFPDFFSWTIRKDGRPDKRNPKSRVTAGKIIKKRDYGYQKRPITKSCTFYHAWTSFHWHNLA